MMCAENLIRNAVSNMIVVTAISKILHYRVKQQNAMFTKNYLKRNDFINILNAISNYAL